MKSSNRKDTDAAPGNSRGRQDMEELLLAGTDPLGAESTAGRASVAMHLQLL